MLNANPVNWFDLPTTDLKRAVGFYNRVFEIEIAITEMFGKEIAFFPNDWEENGAAGALTGSTVNKPSAEGSCVYFACSDDLQSSLDRVVAAGGKVLQEKTAIGDNGFIAHALDTEGNRIGLHSRV